MITERKRLEDDLIAALDKANAALAVKSDFLANMTHELRTPLNAIIGFTGLLRKSDALEARDARQVGLVWDASQSLLGVVNDVLDFSRLEAGAVRFETNAFDPAELAGSTVALLAGEARAKGLTLAVTGEGLSGRLLGDGARLRQVLVNFVSNALKFTAQGGVEIQVAQRPDKANRRLRVAVKDTGIGVATDQVEAIFGRFTRSRRLDLAPVWRHRPRIGNLPTHHPRPRRPARRRQRPGPGLDLLV